jgi:hypothetical protein
MLMMIMSIFSCRSAAAEQDNEDVSVSDVKDALVKIYYLQFPNSVISIDPILLCYIWQEVAAEFANIL